MFFKMILKNKNRWYLKFIFFVVIIFSLVFVSNFSNSLGFVDYLSLSKGVYEKPNINTVEIKRDDLLIKKIFTFLNQNGEEKFCVKFQNFKEEDAFAVAENDYLYYFADMLKINNGWDGVWNLNFKYFSSAVKINLENKETALYTMILLEKVIVKKTVYGLFQIKNFYKLYDQYKIVFLNLDVIIPLNFYRGEKEIYFKLYRKTPFAKRLISTLIGNRKENVFEMKIFKDYFWKANWFLVFEYYQQIIMTKEGLMKMVWYLNLLEEPELIKIT